MRDIGTLPLVTTVAGSYPPSGLPPRRAIQRAVEDQIAAGIDLIADGQPRGDMIASFASRIPGFRLAADGIWEVEDALDLPDGPITARDFAFARGLAGDRAEVKGVVTGPITLALSCRIAPGAPYTAPDDPALILRLAELLAHEVVALVAASARVVQIDEPMLGISMPDRISPELAHDALRDLAAMPPFTILHACGDIRAIAGELLILPFSALAIENARIANLDAFDPDHLDFSDGTLCVGVVDTQDAAIDAIATIQQRIAVAQTLVPTERLWLSPDCGLRKLPPEAAKAKLTNLARAVNQIRATL
jgi:5-methyltetrahydropteroyltriglutamate--homocysteine methyltransferase